MKIERYDRPDADVPILVSALMRVLACSGRDTFTPLFALSIEHTVNVLLLFLIAWDHFVVSRCSRRRIAGNHQLPGHLFGQHWQRSPDSLGSKSQYGATIIRDQFYSGVCRGNRYYLFHVVKF